ncbi:MAG: beta-ketoacyl-ACP synthase [Pseudomonadota bacterium]
MTSFIHAYTLTSAVGTGLEGLRQALAANQGGLVAAEWPDCDVPCYLGPVAVAEHQPLPADRASRNNRLVALALEQDDFAAQVRAACEQWGSDRVGLVMGTSTSSIDRAEAAYRQLDTSDHFPASYQQPEVHNPHAPGDFAAELLGIDGPRLTVSVACASSAKVFATADRWLRQGLVDAVVVGGADSLCLSVIYGFASLQLVAPEPCRPFSPDRQGISLGEAAGFALLSREADEAAVTLLGCGESCDAYHMSSAHPEGLGARLAMERALSSAGLSAAAIDYLNLHGTGTRANDSTEGLVCADVLTARTVMSATKGWTGHTLGAAGIVEAVFCFEALTQGRLAGTRNTKTFDADINLLLDTEARSIDTAMTNSFGFGGNNCSLIFGRP